ncbi:protein-disulfide reductase DsbD family protein [Flavobacterium cerinum]|uniref:Thiol:disulfide interchange protein n=1 Tax=Flavobacterium cerinum TaxID=2502784 RepID=A0A3S3U0N3_9FLAO|nr:cytochrome c biogenesis protein CcdA [Flavobacterium cerinum]RWX00471.1 thiol:disulfide interchange protein [Flavobacterium cerinum]
MKKATFLFFFLFAFLALQAQPPSSLKDPVKWSSKIEKKSDTEYVLVFDAVIEKDWHMYSQFTADGGALPLEVLFNNDKKNFEAVGKAEESKTEKAFNETFGVEETFWSHTAQIKQNIKITNPKSEIVQIELAYQACKEVCIQGSNLFEFNIKTLTSKEVKSFEELVVPVASEKKNDDKAINKHADKEETKGIFTIFFLAFLSGFAALLTPCVFPMIPMTVSFFTKQSKTKAAGIKNAFIYGISIIIIYVLLGSLVTAIFGADSLNALSTNVWFNIIFFVLLVVFACSFLGAFEIMLPNSWANKVDRQADRGGIIGILFMALALAIVSFSCTGPIVGTLLVEAASKGGAAPVIGMLGFSLALALPFMLFAMFPGWLNSLPKSGGWLNTVKVFLGFLELALAFKFLSNADLVLQMHLLERETFLAIWIAIFGALALYLFGKINLPHDSPLASISVGRLLLGLLVLSFTVYMIPGLWGAPLKIISGFPPSMTYSESPYGIGGGSTGAPGSDVPLPDGAHIGPHGIIAFEDYSKGVAYAKEVNKPILIDFTGYACVNCRKMEDKVWSDDHILPTLKKDIVLISLYVDSKKELPASEQYISETTGKKIKTIGNKWSDFQITKYKTNSQPYYILVNLQEENLNDPIGYTPDVNEYGTWLKEGIANFK